MSLLTTWGIVMIIWGILNIFVGLHNPIKKGMLIRGFILIINGLIFIFMGEVLTG